MKKINQKLQILFALVCLTALSETFAQSRPTFNKSEDILIAQFDSKPDTDDIHAQAALGSMIIHGDLNNVNYYAVAGAIGKQNGRFIDSDDLFDMAFGSANWTDAHANWNASVTRIRNKVVPILNAGGKVWVMEAGQSDITADWLKQVVLSVNANTIKNNVVVVQHSEWNQNMTTPADLNYVRNNTRYFYIDDGNAPFGGFGDHGPWSTPEYRSTNSNLIKNAKSSPNQKAKELWTEADRIIQAHGHFPNHSVIKQVNGGVDFSDVVEAWWILSLGSTVDSTPKFWNRYVTNTVASNPPANGNQFFIVNRQTGKKLRPLSGADGITLIQVDQNANGNLVRWQQVNTDNGYFT